ncbi:MAG: hypothetical protein IE932_06485 [Sphingopyxis terrae]|nr:hypothetical protein [Sphingopyxis terrae]
MSLIAILAASLASSSVIVDLSRPILELSCSLRDASKTEYEITLRVSGGQMVVSDGQLVGYTPRVLEVIRDPADLTSRYPDQYVDVAKDYDGHFEASFGQAESGSFHGGLKFTTYGIGSGRRDVRIASLDDGLAGTFAAGGLCNVQEVRQTAIQKGLVGK